MTMLLRRFEGYAVHRCLPSNIAFGARMFGRFRSMLNLHRFSRSKFEKVLSRGSQSELHCYFRLKTFKFFEASNLVPMLKLQRFLPTFEVSKSNRTMSIRVPIDRLRLCCIYSYLRTTFEEAFELNIGGT